MINEIRTVSLNQIDLNDKTFCFSYPLSYSENEVFVKSADEYGIISPVVLRMNHWGGYTVVCGFRRLFWAKINNVQEINAAIINLDGLSCFRLAVSDNLSTRRLNIFEVSTVIDKLIGLFGIQLSVIIKDYLPLLGYPPNINILDRFRFISNFSEPQKKLLYESNIEIEKIIAFAHLDKEAWDNAIDILLKLKPGVNKFNQIIDLIKEISQRENISQKTLLDEPSVKDIVFNEESHFSRKTDMLRDLLSKRRNPTLSKFEEEYLYKYKRLKLKNNIKVIHPQSFEGDTFKAEIVFKDSVELKSALSALAVVCDDKSLDSLINFTTNI